MRLRDAAFTFVGALIGMIGVACSDGPREKVGEMMVDAGRWVADADGVPDAWAQAGSTCEQWEVQSILPERIRWTSFNTTNANGTANEYDFPVMESFTLDAGWEPFGGESLGAVLARRCVR